MPRPPPVEPSARRINIDPGSGVAPRVFAKVRKHVNERIPHLARRSECAPMPPICPQRSAASQELVHVPGDPNRDTAYAARQRLLVRRLDDEMHVVALHGKLHDPKPPRLTVTRAADRELNDGEKVLATQRTEP